MPSRFSSERPRRLSSRARRSSPIPTPPPSSALDRLRRVHGDRLRAMRELGLEVPAAALDRHPRDLAWRVAVMDRWIARHLDLAGGRQLPPWTDEFVPDDPNVLPPRHPDGESA